MGLGHYLLCKLAQVAYPVGANWLHYRWELKLFLQNRSLSIVRLLWGWGGMADEGSWATFFGHLFFFN